MKEMDSILLAGDEMYIQCRTSTNPVDHPWLDPDDLPKNFETLGVKRKLRVEHVGGGNYGMKNLCGAVSDTIKVGMSQSSRAPQIEFHGFLFVGRSKTVSFWPGPEDSYYLYNSHCVSNENAVEQCEKKGAARLFLCDTTVSLSKLLLKDSASDNNFWGVIRLVFTNLC